MADRYRIVVLPQAIEDLDRIASYIAQESPQNAKEIYERLWRAMRSLHVFPRRYKTHRSRRGADNVRSMPEPPWLIYYSIVERQRTVQIHTIRHGSQRQPRRLD